MNYNYMKYIVLIFFILSGACLADDPLEMLLKGVAEHDIKTVESLVRRGMSPDSADSHGDTLLQISSRMGDLPMVNALLGLRASPKLRNALGESALMLAAVGGHAAVARRLIEAGSEVNGDGWTALHYAAWRAHVDVCKLLLDNGADIDARGPNGITPVMMAVRSGDLETVKLLVWEVADLGFETVDGATALSWAEKFGFKKIVQHLRDAGAKK